MRLVPINEAEAIIEPFWDGGSSEYPTDKFSLLSEYAVSVAPGASAAASQLWNCVDVSILSASAGTPAITLTRSCDLELEGYDVFRVFAALPGTMRLSVRACIDGSMVPIINGYAGVNDTDEIDGSFSGRRLTGLELIFEVAEDKPGSCVLMWLGLSNRAAQTRMEARKSRYSPDWPGHFLPAPGKPSPQIGIFFGNDELQHIRERIGRGSLKQVYGRIREKAMEDMKIVPEELIGEFVPYRNFFCRKRDRVFQVTLPDAMERLAFVGLVEENEDMCRLAVRMALSVSYCDYWCETVIGVFPGATWHHRSFTEEVYCRACALVLDWAGHGLTPHGRQVITDAIIMKGLPRIESDFKRMEYIRSMNQGLIFCTGRIIGLLALVHDYPRYDSQILEAEADLMEMLGNYIHGDGGTLEGMSYWNFTFHNVVRALKALSVYHNVPFSGYVPQNVLLTGEYALMMHASGPDGALQIPIGDAHIGECVSATLAAAYYGVTGNPEWKALYHKAEAHRKASTDLFQILFHTDALEGAEKAAPECAAAGLSAMGEIGYAKLTGHVAGIGNTLFFYTSGPLVFGHYHEDKGSFILEAAGETLAMDRGIADYANPECKFMKQAEYHNLLVPQDADGAMLRQPGTAPGGELGPALLSSGLALLASSQKDAWEPGVFGRNIRRVVSPLPGLYIIEDEVECSDELAMNFILNTGHPITALGAGYVISASCVRLSVLPLNWIPQDAQSVAFGIDGRSNPVNRLCLKTGKARVHRLLTALEVLPAGCDAQPCPVIALGRNSVEIAGHGMTLAIHADAAGKTAVYSRTGNGEPLAAFCDGIQWRFAERTQNDAEAGRSPKGQRSL